jgi:hypothetical protein
MQEARNGLRSTAKKILGICPKDRIEHSLFGLGSILEIDERYTTIAFDESGTRKFVTSIVELAPSDTPAPARSARKRKKVGQAGCTKPVSSSA